MNHREREALRELLEFCAPERQAMVLGKLEAIVDPDEALKMAIQAMEDGGRDLACEALEGLLDWIRKGGFMPQVREYLAASKLVDSLNGCLEIVETEYETDPEPEDLDSWKRTIEQGNRILDWVAGEEGAELD